MRLALRFHYDRARGRDVGMIQVSSIAFRVYTQKDLVLLKCLRYPGYSLQINSQVSSRRSEDEVAVITKGHKLMGGVRRRSDLACEPLEIDPRKPHFRALHPEPAEEVSRDLAGFLRDWLKVREQDLTDPGEACFEAIAAFPFFCDGVNSRLRFGYPPDGIVTTLPSAQDGGFGDGFISL
jgi:hypothetical protein